MIDKFLSHLITRNKLTPEDFSKVSGVRGSPQFFAMIAFLQNIITKDQCSKISRASANSTPTALASLLLKNKIISRRDMQRVLEMQKNDVTLIERLIRDLGIMTKEALAEEAACFNELRAEMEKEDDKPHAVSIILVAEKDTYRNDLEKTLIADGHELLLHDNALDATKVFNENGCDLVIANLELDVIDGVTMASQMMEQNKQLHAAVYATSPESYKLPSKLYFEERFLFESRENFIDELKPFTKTLGDKKATLERVKETASNVEVQAVDEKEIKEWCKRVKVDYSPDGVMLFIDPDKVPRPADQYKLEEQEKSKYLAFIDAVYRQLCGMRIHKIDVKAIELCVWYPWREGMKVAPRQEPSSDATANFSLSADGRFVEMDYAPPVGKGRRLDKRITLLKIREVARDYYIIESTIDNLRASSDPIQGAPVAEKLDARAEISISPDGTEAFIKLHRPFGGAPIEYEEVVKQVKELGIVEGVDQHIIKEICHSSFWDRKIQIAVGRLPVDGKDGKLREMKLDDVDERRATSRGIDHRVVKSMDRVIAGEHLITAEPPTDGISGVNVKGEVLPCKPGKPVKFVSASSSDSDATVILGDNVELVLDGTRVIASIDGMLKRDGRRIDVVPVFEVDGDVDYSVGNLDVSGDVLIRGSVLSKFEVRATGDVHVLGSVEDAVIESNGSIFIEQGVYGGEKAILIARRSILARCIEQANVFCRRSVIVQTNVSHSRVVAFRDIKVTGPGGFIVGGDLKAGFSISAARLGSQSGTITSLQVGSALNVEKEMEELNAWMLKKIAITENLSLPASEKETQSRDETAPDEDDGPENIYKGMRVKPYNLYFLKRLDSYVAKYKNRLPSFKPDSRTAPYKITSENLARPGVHMKIKGLNFIIKDELSGKRVFSLHGEKIVESV